MTRSAATVINGRRRPPRARRLARGTRIGAVGRSRKPWNIAEWYQGKAVTVPLLGVDVTHFEALTRRFSENHLKCPPPTPRTVRAHNLAGEALPTAPRALPRSKSLNGTIPDRCQPP